MSPPPHSFAMSWDFASDLAPGLLTPRLRLGLLALGLMMFSATAPALAQGGLTLAYQAFLGPLPILDVRAQLMIPLMTRAVTGSAALGPYQAQIVGRSNPMMAKLYDWSFTVRADGAMTADGPAPSQFTGEHLSERDSRPVTITYGPGGTADARFNPPGADAPPRGLKPGDLTGTIDPASALVSVMEQAARTRNCGGTLRIFDGRRRYDLTLTAAGEDTIPAEPGALYSGEAVRCAFAIHQLDKGPDRLPKSGSLWLAQIPGSESIVPVR
jgi:uncharacterized protein DUF3108